MTYYFGGESGSGSVDSGLRTPTCQLVQDEVLVEMDHSECHENEGSAVSPFVMRPTTAN